MIVWGITKIVISYERLVKVFVLWKPLKDVMQRVMRSDSCFDALERSPWLQCGEWAGWPDQRPRYYLGSYCSSSWERGASWTGEVQWGREGHLILILKISNGGHEFCVKGEKEVTPKYLI